MIHRAKMIRFTGKMNSTNSFSTAKGNSKYIIPSPPKKKHSSKLVYWHPTDLSPVQKDGTLLTNNSQHCCLFAHPVACGC